MNFGNYSPIYLGDTRNLTPEEFSVVRKHGFEGLKGDFSHNYIGGSSASVILGVGTNIPAPGEVPHMWQTPLDIYQDIKGIPPENPDPEDPFKNDIFFAGHNWEPYVANMVNRMEGYSNAKIIDDTGFYQHPYYPFATANVDRIIFNNGRKGVLEIKTTDWSNFEKIRQWKAGIIPPNYEIQIRWYMGVLNLPFADIICAWGFTPRNMKIIHIERDLDLEEKIFGAAAEFMANTEKGIAPFEKMGTLGGAAVKAMQKHFFSDPNTPEVVLPENMFEDVAKLQAVIKEEQEIEKAYNTAKARISSKKEILQARIVCKMGKSDTAIVEDAYGHRLTVSWKSVFRHGVDAAKLKEKDPLVFKKFEKISSWRKFTIK